MDQIQLCSLSFGCFCVCLHFYLEKRGTQSSLSKPVVLQITVPTLPNPSKNPTTHPQGQGRVLNSASGALWSSQLCFCVSAAFEYGLWNVQLVGRRGLDCLITSCVIMTIPIPSQSLLSLRKSNEDSA